MTAALTYTRRPLLLRLQRAIAIAWYRYEIRSDEQWIADCERDGITDTEQMHLQRKAVAALRVRLAIWQAR